MNRTLLTFTAMTALFSAPAMAQDMDVYYTTPTVQAGQPVVVPVTPTVRAVPVYTPVPVVAHSNTGPAAVDDTSYLGAPAIQTSQHDASVTFVSGGIGMVEKKWFDTQSKDYALKVTYSDTTGHHLAGVNVTLADSKGTTVLSAITEGPYLLVNAKPGTYTLTSAYEGATKTSKVTLGGGLKRTVVTFNDTNL